MHGYNYKATHDFCATIRLSQTKDEHGQSSGGVEDDVAVMSGQEMAGDDGASGDQGGV